MGETDAARICPQCGESTKWEGAKCARCGSIGLTPAQVAEVRTLLSRDERISACGIIRVALECDFQAALAAMRAIESGTIASGIAGPPEAGQDAPGAEVKVEQNRSAGSRSSSFLPDAGAVIGLAILCFYIAVYVYVISYNSNRTPKPGAQVWTDGKWETVKMPFWHGFTGPPQAGAIALYNLAASSERQRSIYGSTWGIGTSGYKVAFVLSCCLLLLGFRPVIGALVYVRVQWERLSRFA